MNKWIGAGRLTKDPEFKTTNRDVNVCNFTVAVDRRFKKEGSQTADFLPCIAFGKTAEFVSKYFVKGKMIVLDGSIQTRTWEDDENKKHYVTEIMVDNVEFGGDGSGTASKSKDATSDTPKTKPAEIVSISDSENDLPF